MRFKIVEEMLEYLAFIYTDPNKVRNARHNYNILVIKGT
jgi:hypothetical protein